MSATSGICTHEAVSAAHTHITQSIHYGRHRLNSSKAPVLQLSLSPCDRPLPPRTHPLPRRTTVVRPYPERSRASRPSSPRMHSATGFFSRKPPPSPIAATTSSPHRATAPSPASPVSPTSSSAAAVAAAASPHDSPSSEPRRRHGSAPLVNAFGLMRRDSMPAASSSSAAAGSRRSLSIEVQHPGLARKTSESGTVHKQSPLSPKRKPLPKGSAFDKPNSDDGNEMHGKLGKMDLTNGSTMVSPLDPTS